MYPVKYEAEITSEYNNWEIEKVKGITFGESWADAASKIEEFYGNELIWMKMEMLEEASVYEFEEDD